MSVTFDGLQLAQVAWNMSVFKKYLMPQLYQIYHLQFMQISFFKIKSFRSNYKHA